QDSERSEAAADIGLRARGGRVGRPLTAATRRSGVDQRGPGLPGSVPADVAGRGVGGGLSLTPLRHTQSAHARIKIFALSRESGFICPSRRPLVVIASLTDAMTK